MYNYNAYANETTKAAAQEIDAVFVEKQTHELQGDYQNERAAHVFWQVAEEYLIAHGLIVVDNKNHTLAFKVDEEHGEIRVRSDDDNQDESFPGKFLCKLADHPALKAKVDEYGSFVQDLQGKYNALNDGMQARHEKAWGTIKTQMIKDGVIIDPNEKLTLNGRFVVPTPNKDNFKKMIGELVKGMDLPEHLKQRGRDLGILN